MVVCSLYLPKIVHSKNYRDAAMSQGVDPNRRLPNVALPGQSSTSSGHHVNFMATDIVLNTNRAITEEENSAWIPRIDQASKSVTNFLRHGSPDKRFNIHSPDGYIRESNLAHLPGFRKWKIDHRVLEIILMHGRKMLMTKA